MLWLKTLLSSGQGSLLPVYGGLLTAVGSQDHKKPRFSAQLSQADWEEVWEAVLGVHPALERSPRKGVGHREGIILMDSHQGSWTIATQNWTFPRPLHTLV